MVKGGGEKGKLTGISNNISIDARLELVVVEVLNISGSSIESIKVN